MSTVFFKRADDNFIYGVERQGFQCVAYKISHGVGTKNKMLLVQLAVTHAGSLRVRLLLRGRTPRRCLPVWRQAMSPTCTHARRF